MKAYYIELWAYETIAKKYIIHIIKLKEFKDGLYEVRKQILICYNYARMKMIRYIRKFVSIYNNDILGVRNV